MRYLRRNQTPAMRAALELETMLGVGTPRQKRRYDPRSSLRSALVDIEHKREHKSWSDAHGRHFVALFVWLHTQVYGVEPEEIFEKKSYVAAIAMADRRCRTDFRGDPAAMIEYERWVWKRERTMEKRRRESGQDGRRISWQLLFVARNLLVDYRVKQNREGAAKA